MSPSAQHRRETQRFTPLRRRFDEKLATLGASREIFRHLQDQHLSSKKILYLLIHLLPNQNSQINAAMSFVNININIIIITYYIIFLLLFLLGQIVCQSKVVFTTYTFIFTFFLLTRL